MRYLLFVLLLAACDSGPPVHTDFNPRADFSSYSTWQFEEEGSDSGVPPAVVDLLHEAIREELAAKSMVETQDGADLSLALVIVLSEESGGGGGAYYWDARGDTGPSDQYVIEEGTLILDFYDNANGQRVWRGVTSGVISRTGDHDPEALDAVIQAMLAQYPPSTGEQ